MPRPCSGCLRPDRPALDAALQTPEPVRSIGVRFSLSRSAVSRHRAHLKRDDDADRGARQAENRRLNRDPENSERTADRTASYRCERWPFLMVGDRVRFNGGHFETADPDLQRLIESLPYFGVVVLREDP